MLTETRNEGTKSSEAVLQAAAQRLREADAVLVGASNGFSITEGLNLFAQDEAFEAIFGDFSRTYGIRSILHGMSVRWPDDAHYWAFWSRLIDRYTVGYEPSRVMRDLFALLEGKDAFILTTNGEGHFSLSGVPEERLCEPEGNWLAMQCARGCCAEVRPTLDAGREMAGESRGSMTVSPARVPRCPHCGAPMRVHVMLYDNFLPDEAGRENFEAFLAGNARRKLVILELGVGQRNPFIKGQFLALAQKLPQAAYLPVNLSEPYVPRAIRDKTLPIAAPIDETLARLRRLLDD